MELRQLSHSISIDVLTVRNAVFFIFIAFALVLRLFIVFILVISSLVQEWWVGVVQDVLGVRPNFPESIDKPLSCLVDLGVCVV